MHKLTLAAGRNGFTHLLLLVCGERIGPSIMRAPAQPSGH